MSAYLWGAAWALSLLLAWVGWGGALARALGRRGGVDWGQRAAWGLAASVAVGGWLNLAGVAFGPVLIALVVAGIVAWLIDLLVQARASRTSAGSARLAGRLRGAALRVRRQPLLTLLALGAAGLIGLQCAGFVSSYEFDHLDDVEAYMVFPAKMIQTGHMGSEPFNGHRIEAGLGGQYFLMALVLSGAQERNLNTLDPCLGLLLLVGLVIGAARKRGAGAGAIVGVLWALAIVCAWKLNTNTTAQLLGAALLLSLWRTLAEAPDAAAASGRRGALIGLLAAALITLKSPLMLPAGAMVALWYGLRLLSPHRRRGVALELLLAAIAGAAVLLPWAISQYQAVGTPMYPLLRGYHGSRYGELIRPMDELSPRRAGRARSAGDRAAGDRAAAGGRVRRLALAAPLREGRLKDAGASAPSRSAADALLALVLAAAAGTLAVGQVMAGYGQQRYAFAFVLAAVLAAAITAAGEGRRPPREAPAAAGLPAARRQRRVWPAAALLPLVAVALMAGGAWEHARQRYWRTPDLVRAGLRGAPLVGDAAARSHRAAQAAVPAGATLLARLDYPIALDFRRNRVWIIDVPGLCSPPPGLPAFRGPEALAAYLKAQGVRYVAYSYATQASFPHQRFDYFTRPDFPYAFLRSQAQHIFDFQDNLALLRQEYTPLYDDGSIFVLDLERGAAAGAG